MEWYPMMKETNFRSLAVDGITTGGKIDGQADGFPLDVDSVTEVRD